ncbi:hypothetical protein SporoP37_01270 [Sporosarcina sp. P37]|uniref:hypothetical protein n=1 Tax=unclassified Sporosarcina TaxID=2647733 RepID=UPI000A17AB9B|nr:MULTISPECIES: hypothetical protein [unclassified Sporosarcina]ARK23454.1 hypothetical protein SporoP37_01270 [Sporosarcina sp. P37]PID18665.1 hypothetical protein CSV62_07385 [Sporosarcina sp. P35]
MKRNLWFLMAALLLVLAGCTSKPATSIDGKTDAPETNVNDTSDKPTEQDANANSEKTEVSLLDYFLPDGSAAHYKGEGNEFAELDITVARPAQDYVVIHENNGGSFVQKVYKLNGDEIQVLQEEHAELDAGIPTTEELKAMEPIRTYLKGPIEVGTTFDDWKIVEMNASVETPYQQFEDVVVIEQAEQDFVNRIYLVKDFGEIKRESIMSMEGEEEFVVTSTLETVTQP